jgi:hypothetical protein
MLIFSRILVVLLVVVALAVEKRRLASATGVSLSPADIILRTLAALNIGFIIFLFFNHLFFPLNLDLMEGTVLEHCRRALHGLPVYPAPTPEYVPLAYNPLYCYVSVPFCRLFGDGLATLRFVSILGMATIGIFTFLVVRNKTGSTAAGYIALGLFAAAYMAMDAYLDSAHSDSWLIATAMLGTLLLDGNKSVVRNMVGLLLLVASFWFKQHGAVFAVGGLLFLFLHSGWKTSLVYALVVLIAGPAVYLFAGQHLFGTYFHYFTWSVPSQWSEITSKTFLRYFGLIALNYLPVAVPACWWWLLQFRKGMKDFDVWRFQLPFAMLTGFMGALDAGSSNNVFIAQGVWFIVVGMIALKEIGTRYPWFGLNKGAQILVACTFAFFLYDPQTVVVSSQADAKYEELLDELKKLPGQVYAPSLGQLQRGYEFFPTANWVALEDMIRGPGKNPQNHANTRLLLAPLLGHENRHYILANVPLSSQPFLAFLQDYYIMEKDYADRFKPLRVLPKRSDHGWPQYLYRQKNTQN